MLWCSIARQFGAFICAIVGRSSWSLRTPSHESMPLPQIQLTAHDTWSVCSIMSGRSLCVYMFFACLITTGILRSIPSSRIWGVVMLPTFQLAHHGRSEQQYYPKSQFSHQLSRHGEDRTAMRRAWLKEIKTIIYPYKSTVDLYGTCVGNYTYHTWMVYIYIDLCYCWFRLQIPLQWQIPEAEVKGTGLQGVLGMWNSVTNGFGCFQK